jgi:hypothetical protein
MSDSAPYKQTTAPNITCCIRSTTQLPPHHNLEKLTHHHQNRASSRRNIADSGTVPYVIKHLQPHSNHRQYYYILSLGINFMEGKDALRHKEQATKEEEKLNKQF